MKFSKLCPSHSHAFSFPVKSFDVSAYRWQACEHGRQQRERGRRSAGSHLWRCAVRGACYPPRRVAARGCPKDCARRE
jgi:succinate dehydrogenase/fumarate reductase-like Fe-S protein